MVTESMKQIIHVTRGSVSIKIPRFRALKSTVCFHSRYLIHFPSAEIPQLFSASTSRKKCFRPNYRKYLSKGVSGRGLPRSRTFNSYTREIRRENKWSYFRRHRLTLFRIAKRDEYKRDSRTWSAFRSSLIKISKVTPLPRTESQTESREHLWSSIFLKKILRKNLTSRSNRIYNKILPIFILIPYSFG